MLGKFITFEGIDGSGKTTILEFLSEYLKEKKINVLTTREPGGTAVSEKIRDIIVYDDIDGITESLLFAASRREHIIKKIIPALNNGCVVLCDRYVDSSVAYQAYGRSLNKKTIIDINKYATNNLTPDLTLFFDVDVECGLSRTKLRGETNRLDNEKITFYEKVRAGYIDLLNENDRIIKIDSNKSIEEVKVEVINIIERFLENDRL